MFINSQLCAASVVKNSDLMIPVPWLLPELQKMINEYVTGHEIYNKCLLEYNTKVHYDENTGFPRGIFIIKINSDKISWLIRYCNIYNYSRKSR